MIIEFFTTNLLFGPGMPVFLVILALFFIAIFFRLFLFIAVPLLIFSLYFFRNPDRICLEAQTDASVLISPADGKVVAVEQSATNEFDGYAQRISIFLSPLDVHVNWTPCAGSIQKVHYCPGKFLVAYAPKASEINERNDIVIQRQDGQTLVVRQIAGFVARRIVCWVQPDEVVSAGYKYGMIRFGSRVDVLLPANVAINVQEGDRVYGGQTVLAHWKDIV